MDPIANMEEQQRHAAKILAWYESDASNAPPTEEITAHAVRLAELAQALDGWLQGGGILARARRRR